MIMEREQTCQGGLIGLGVMGWNLAQQLGEKGVCLGIYNRTGQVTDERLNGYDGENLHPFYTLEKLCSALERPRKIILMVKAGQAVDGLLESLLGLLEPGDIIIDGGNSYFKDTQNRAKRCREKGIVFVGAGISGGEEGARHGAAIMPGCSQQVWPLIAPLLLPAAAQAEGEPCCTPLEGDGAGHFVKMVHNGIEYADMQLIAECVYLLRQGAGWTPEKLAALFEEWNQGELESYLVEITGHILSQRDEETGRPMVDVIRGRAGNKGTGKWTTMEGLDLGQPVPTIAQAVFARYLSAQEEERQKAAQALEGGTAAFVMKEEQDMAETLRRALYCAKVCAYAQGFALMSRAGQEYGWKLKLDRVAAMFRGGCIIRARFLNDIRKAYEEQPDLSNLLLHPAFSRKMGEYVLSLRQVVAWGALSGVALPAFSSALSYYDGLRDPVGSASLIQAQRDYFGAHTFQRVDRDGMFHRQWF